MKENNHKKFFSLLSDTTFKYLFKKEENKPFFRKTILDVTGIDINGYTLIDNEINSGNNKKDYRLDILLKKDDSIINIEMNQFISRNYYNPTSLKNRNYLYSLASSTYTSGDKFKIKYITQINFNNSLCPTDKHITNVTFKLADAKHNVYLDDIKIHEIYLESFKHSCYTNLGNKDYRLLMFTAKSFTEMKALAGTDKEALNIVDELEKLNKDKYFGGLYDNEVIQKKLNNSYHDEGYNEGYSTGYDLGKKETNKEIALNMLKMQIDIKTISEVTNFSVDEIKSIIENKKS